MSMSYFPLQTTWSLCLLSIEFIATMELHNYNIVHSYSLVCMCKLVGLHSFIQLQNPHGWTQV